MADPTLLKITNGLAALLPVDTAASGYLPAWQAPAGATALTAALAAYSTNSQAWTCQLTSGRLNASKQSNRADRAATFCAPASSDVQPSQTTYTLDLSFFQDAHVRDGFQSFCFQNDTLEAYFLLAANAALAPPRAIGRVTIHAAGFLGDPQVSLTDSVSFDVTRKPDIVFGTTGSTRLITGAGVVTSSP